MHKALLVTCARSGTSKSLPSLILTVSSLVHVRSPESNATIFFIDSNKANNVRFLDETNLKIFRQLRINLRRFLGHSL